MALLKKNDNLRILSLVKIIRISRQFKQAKITRSTVFISNIVYKLIVVD